MILADAAARITRPRLADAAVPIGVSALVLIGYGAAADARIALAGVAAAVVAAWAAVAIGHPRVALTLSFSLLLIAGTKFRTRDADASLAGTLDAQILLELGLFALIGIAVTATWFAMRAGGRRLSPIELAVMSYGALAAVSTLWSAAPMLTAVRSLQLIVVGAFAVLAVRAIGSAHTLWITARALALHVIGFAAIAAASPWAWDTFRTEDAFDGGFRFRWFAVHPIEVATLAGMGALGLLGARAFETATPAARARIRAGLWAMAVVAVLVLTSSRGPMLALAAGLFVLWLFRVRPAVRTAAMLLTAAAACAAIAFAPELRTATVWLAEQDTAVTRLFFRGQSAETLFELNGRLGLWEDLRPVVADHMALGLGYQASRATLLDVAAWAAYAHNAFLQTALDLGIGGVVIVLGLLGYAARGAFVRGADNGVRATVAAFVVFSTLNAMSTESFAAVPRFETLLLFLCALCTEANRVRRVETTPARNMVA